MTFTKSIKVDHNTDLLNRLIKHVALSIFYATVLGVELLIASVKKLD